MPEKESIADQSQALIDSKYWWLFLAISIVSQTIIGGVRFSDAGALSEIAQNGFEAELGPASQYLLDSQLKVFLLHTLGIASPLGLALLFAILTVIPLPLVLLVRDQERRLRLAIFLAVLPVAKICLQNIGVGDSITITLLLFAALASSWIPTGLAVAALGLWHPQQGLVLSAFLGMLTLVRGKESRGRGVLILATSAIVFVIFLCIKSLVLPEGGVDRIGYIRERFGYYAPRNLFYLPVVLAAAVPGVLAAISFRKEQSRLAFVASLLLLIPALAISFLAEDFSRLFIILSLPTMLSLIGLLGQSNFKASKLSHQQLWTLIALNAMVPIFSWSGIDIYLWTDLLNDLKKYLPT
jgi:hypothetical protein